MSQFQPTGNSFGSKRKYKRYLKYVALAPIPIALVLLIVIIGRALGNKPPANATNSQNPSVAGAIETADINREFFLPVTGPDGEELGRLKVSVLSAEKRKEIYVKGQKATAVSGREFLIINMKIDNELQRSVEIKTRNYVRLAINGNENEWLAPDIHNDPVEVQAISTKLTRVGFPINSTDSNLMLQIGEIKSEKDKFALEF